MSRRSKKRAQMRRQIYHYIFGNQLARLILLSAVILLTCWLLTRDIDFSNQITSINLMIK